MEKITYNGKDYRTRTFEVTIDEHKDDWVHCYKIAEEELLDDIQANEGDEWEDYENTVAKEIYHYVENGVLDLSAEEICAKHLDLPMTFISEETY